VEKTSLRVFGLFGIVLFGPLFLYTFADPQLIEKSGESFISGELQSAIEKKIDSIKLPELTKLEKALGTEVRSHRAETELTLEKLKQQLKAEAPAMVATELIKLRELDCECRKNWEKSLSAFMQLKLVSLEKAKIRIIAFSHAKYMAIVEKLTLDARIFLSVNAIVFTFLLVASFIQPRAVKHLFLPGGLMLVATTLFAYFYLFNQNWFYTIIYNDYTGLGYMTYLVFVFAILCDIMFNKARVTTKIINRSLRAIGRAGILVQC